MGVRHTVSTNHLGGPGGPAFSRILNEPYVHVHETKTHHTNRLSFPFTSNQISVPGLTLSVDRGAAGVTHGCYC